MLASLWRTATGVVLYTGMAALIALFCTISSFLTRVRTLLLIVFPSWVLVLEGHHASDLVVVNLVHRPIVNLIVINGILRTGVVVFAIGNLFPDIPGLLSMGSTGLLLPFGFIHHPIPGLLLTEP
jgi:hypothetical protein